MSQGPTATVSVVVPCRNEAKRLPVFLDSLLSQRLEGIHAEFLIADGRSDDESRKVLAGYVASDPRIRVIDNPGRIVSTGLNAAIEASVGSYIIRMDAHSEFAPDYIQSCVRVLEQTGADNVGGAARVNTQGSRMSRAIAAAYQSPFSTGGARFHNADYEGPVDTVTYGCWRRDIFERVGLFDEALVRNQDDEFNLRCSRAGCTIWQSRQIQSWYHPRTNLWQLFRQYFQYGFWKVAVIRKHRIPASWRHLVPGGFFLTLALLLLFIAGSALLEAWPLAKSAGLVLAGILGCYLFACLVFSWRTAREKGQDLFPILPVVFATYHASYGLGFLAGIARSTRANSAHTPGALFTGLSR